MTASTAVRWHLRVLPGCPVLLGEILGDYRGEDEADEIAGGSEFSRFLGPVPCDGPACPRCSPSERTHERQ